MKKNMYPTSKNEFAKQILETYKNNYPCKIIFDIESSGQSNFDWLVIKNELSGSPHIATEEIISRLKDPLDFNDGHMSLLTEKEYFSKLLDVKNENILNENIFKFEVEYFETGNFKTGYFVTRLPIIKQEDIK